MDSVMLMDRMDSKYAFRQERLEAFLEELKKSYRVLDVSGHRISRYESIYFDTKNFDLYHHHHNERCNRYKIRFRKYVESGLNFFEIKFKNNKGRTVKKRIMHPLMEETIQGNTEKFLHDRTHLSARQLEAKLWVNFFRITLVNRFSPERVTIDLHLTFRNNGTVQTKNNLIIAETKQEKSGRSEFVRLMKQHHIREGSLSKYCYGISCLFGDLKNNNFKPQLKRFNKLLHATPSES
jgi:VTC domain-containing protein